MNRDRDSTHNPTDQPVPEQRTYGLRGRHDLLLEPRRALLEDVQELLREPLEQRLRRQLAKARAFMIVGTNEEHLFRRTGG